MGPLVAIVEHELYRASDTHYELMALEVSVLPSDLTTWHAIDPKASLDFKRYVFLKLDYREVATKVLDLWKFVYEASGQFGYFVPCS